MGDTSGAMGGGCATVSNVRMLPAVRLGLDVCHVPEALVLMTNYFPSSDMAPWEGSWELGCKPEHGVLCLAIVFLTSQK